MRLFALDATREFGTRVAQALGVPLAPHEERAVIFASGNLDEHRVQALVDADAPIASFGIGTSVTTSADAPFLDMVYKLQEYDGAPRRKRSTGKATWPGRKQVWRRFDSDGVCAGDKVALEDESRPGSAVPLLAQVMHAGRRVSPSPALDAVRAHCAAQMACLPPQLKRIAGPCSHYSIAISPAIRRLAVQVDGRRSASEAHTEPLSLSEVTPSPATRP